MQFNEDKLREYFARNLTTYRKGLGLTQLELAEKLNYSDKSISKWERGDGLPDLAVTIQIAEILGVTVNDLISQKTKKVFLTRNKLIVTLLSIGLVWLVATILFVIFSILLPQFKSWLFFVYAIPISSIVSIVFTCIWWKKLHRFIAVSLLIWSIALCITVTFSKTALIFVISGVLQIMTILFFLLKSNKH